MMEHPLRIEFTKMSGAGNDFVLVNNLDGTIFIDWKSLAQSVCDRVNGVGADGLLVLDPPRDEGDFSMQYYNSDGSFGAMCGNGARCAAFYYSTLREENSVVFQSLGHVYRAERSNGLVSLKIPDLQAIPEHLDINLEEFVVPLNFLNTGAPHAVIDSADLPASVRGEFSTQGIEKFARRIRNHPTFGPEGTNVNFITGSHGTELTLRTYERGVEGETLACGTGAIAAAMIFAGLSSALPPIVVIPKSGERLSVDFVKTGSVVKDITLTGPALIVFRGWIEFDGHSIREVTVP